MFSHYPGKIQKKEMTVEEEIKSLGESYFAKNWLNFSIGALIIGALGIGTFYIKEDESKRYLENYTCSENIKSDRETSLKFYAKAIVEENPDKGFDEKNVLEFLVKSHNKDNDSVKRGEDIVIPIYSHQVCYRLGLIK